LLYIFILIDKLVGADFLAEFINSYRKSKDSPFLKIGSPEARKAVLKLKDMINEIGIGKLKLLYYNIIIK